MSFGCVLFAACGQQPQYSRTILPAPEPHLAQLPNRATFVHGRTVQEWYAIAINKTKNKLLREQAMHELAGAGRPGLRLLFDLLDAEDKDTVDPNGPFGIQVIPGFVRSHAATEFGRLGPAGLPAERALRILMLHDEVIDVRAAAAKALNDLCVHQPETVQAFKDILRRPDYQLWAAAAFALGRIQPQDQDTQSLLANLSHLNLSSVRNDNQLGAALINARTQARAALRQESSPCRP